MNTFEKFILQNRLIDIASKINFDITLADFKHIINNDFIQLEAE